MSYHPAPIEISGVALFPELEQLTEHLADNAHDFWAAQRISQGWAFGPRRDDAQKQHPCLVAYAALPEKDNEFDRIAALGTLKAILTLSYQILPPHH